MTTTVAVVDAARYKGAIAVEYEIRDGLGNVLGADTVIASPNPGETMAQMRGLFADFFRRRAAKWELSTTSEQRARRRESRISSRFAALTVTRGGAPLGAVAAVAVTTAEALALWNERTVTIEGVPVIQRNFEV